MKLWIAAALVTFVAAQERTPPLASFRASANAVVLDVSVVDDRNRPVMGLTAGDFTILEGGVERPLLAFDAVNVASASPTPPSWPAPDVVTNEDVQAGRVLAVVMDDSTPMPVADGPHAKEAARALINRMSPLDRAAIIFTADREGNQDFTRDRARLYAAIERFRPRPDLGSTDRRLSESRNAPNNFIHFDPTASTLYARLLRTLRSLVEGLGGFSAGRKSIVLISVGLPIEIRERARGDFSSDVEDPEFAISPVDSLPDPSNQKDLLKKEILETIRAAARALVRIYAIDPGGLRAPLGAAGSDEFNIGTGNRVFLQGLSKVTGGFAVVGTNDVNAAAPQILADTGAYYLLGYQSANGGAIQVKVNRPGTTVQVRPPATLAAGATRTPDVSTALRNLLPVRGLDMQLTVAPFAIPGGTQSALAVVVGFREDGPATGAALAETVQVVVNVSDPAGKSVASKTTSVSAGLPAGATNVRFEVLSRLDVKPGRYQVRVAAQAASDRDVGSVFTDVDVPDYSKTGVALSGLVFSAAPGRLATPRNALQNVVSVIPTAQREFERSQSVTATLRVYAAGPRSAGEVDMITEVRTASGGVAFGSRDVITAAEFDVARSREFRVEIPVRSFAPGPYLLTIEAAPRGGTPARVEVPFGVR